MVGLLACTDDPDDTDGKRSDTVDSPIDSDAPELTETVRVRGILSSESTPLEGASVCVDGGGCVTSDVSGGYSIAIPRHAPSMILVEAEGRGLQPMAMYVETPGEHLAPEVVELERWIDLPTIADRDGLLRAAGLTWNDGLVTVVAEVDAPGTPNGLGGATVDFVVGDTPYDTYYLVSTTIQDFPCLPVREPGRTSSECGGLAATSGLPTGSVRVDVDGDGHVCGWVPGDIAPPVQPDGTSRFVIETVPGYLNLFGVVCDAP
jgi:hypothetical protein